MLKSIPNNPFVGEQLFLDKFAINSIRLTISITVIKKCFFTFLMSPKWQSA